MAIPLTTKTREGAAYTRLPGVEAAIDAAIALDEATRLGRAENTDARRGGMGLECLLYLVRTIGPGRHRDRLLQILLARCEAVLVRKLPDQRWHLAESVREEVLGRFAELLAEDLAAPRSGVLDFFEVRFLAAFAALRVSVVRAEIARTEPLGVAGTKDGTIYDRRTDDKPPDDAERVAALDVAGSFTEANQEQHLEVGRVFDAVDELPAEERQAFALCQLLGYEIESDNPEKPTAATRSGVTGRTVRNRLSRVAKKLERFERKP
jgi:hypothetical protein